MLRPVTTGLAITALAAAVLPAAADAAAPTVRTGAGGDPAAIAPARDAFRADLGGGTTAGANGSFGGLRREINWDGVPDAQSTPNNLNPAFFNANSPRGAVFETPGSAVQVSSLADPKRFGQLNASYPGQFQTFSPEKLFTPVGSNVTDVRFFVPGTTTPASVSGFGAVFADVDAADTTAIDYYGEDGALLDKVVAPVGDLAFAGATFTDGRRVSRVRIRTGNTAVPASDAGPAQDVVVMDDFLYGEPREVVATPPAAGGGQNGGQTGGGQTGGGQTGNGQQGGGQPPAPAPPAAADTAPPALRTSVKRALRLATLRRGVTAKATCGEPCKLRFELKRGSRVLDRAALGLGSGTRSARLKPSRRALARAPRRFSVRLRVIATDQAGNRSVAARAIAVTR